MLINWPIDIKLCKKLIKQFTTYSMSGMVFTVHTRLHEKRKDSTDIVLQNCIFRLITLVSYNVLLHTYCSIVIKENFI